MIKIAKTPEELEKMKELYEKVIQYYKLDFSIREIASMLSLTYYEVRQILVDNGLYMKRGRRAR